MANAIDRREAVRRVTAMLGGVVFVGGILWAILRRYVQRPYRIRIKTKPEDAFILGTFLLIGLSGFFVEAFRIARKVLMEEK